ncbi:MAG: T9SS type A sorting domain-containing protein [Candidatus Cloacimonetes bacterium]|nr:T9SS type A sorting domain-containing protein [Candidatus Cloacimonadota bacterium]
MKKGFVLLIFIVFLSTLFAEINDVYLAVSAGEDEELFYDHDAGIYRDEDNIYLAYYRVTFEAGTVLLNLNVSISDDNGIEFSEHEVITLQYEGYNFYDLYSNCLPSIWVDDDMIYVFYLDFETANSMVAISNDLGETFSFQELTGMPGRSQFKTINRDGELLFGAVISEDKIPMSRFQYLTKFEESENLESYDPEDYSGDILFFGPEHNEGMTASDDDIWIRQIGGGSNNGWPTFDQLVMTSGLIMDYSTGAPAVNTAPMDDIFTAGYIEQAAHFNFLGGSIRENGYILDGSIDRDVLLAEIDGNIAHLRYADWITQIDTFTVYNSFPDPMHPDLTLGDSIWTNEVTTRELVWDEDTFDLTIYDNSVFVYCQLWIEGSIGSNMTWGCADTVYITSDICYADIEMGDPAEDSEFLFGLVSEERIYYKYKYRDFEGNIHDDNCNDLYIYGSYAALGDGNIELYGDMNTHYEGIITPEYQHPHGSTPSFTIELPQGDWFVKYPDLHKFIFPPSPYWTGDPGFQFHGNEPVNNNGFFTCGYPYENPGYGDFVTPPFGADYPWYNPVYPEAACPEMGERGAIHQYGGMQQRRCGYVHRSGCGPNNHSGNEWDIEHWQYSGTHGMMGYDQDYHWDTRLENDAPPDYPEIELMLGSFGGAEYDQFALYSFNPDSISVDQLDYFDLDDGYDHKMIDFCILDDKPAFLVGSGYYDNKIITRIAGEWSVIDIDTIPRNSLELWLENYIVKRNDGINVLDTQGLPITLPDLNQFSSLADYQPGYNGVLFTVTGEAPLWHLGIREVGNIPLMGEYDFGIASGAFPYHGTIEISLASADQIVMQILRKDNSFPYSTDYIYIATGDVSDLLTGTIDDEIVLSPQFNCYPNPFNPEVNLSFSLDHTGFVEITIFNIKGQIVEQLINETYSSGDHSITWQPPAASSGIYLAQYKLDQKLISSRKLTLLK